MISRFFILNTKTAFEFPEGIFPCKPTDDALSRKSITIAINRPIIKDDEPVKRRRGNGKWKESTPIEHSVEPEGRGFLPLARVTSVTESLK